MNALAHALALAERGVPSFPCLASKAPACPGGFKAATDDRDTLQALWGRYPGGLIGVPTGAASGFDALDIDPRHGGDAWEQGHASRLPQTRVHVTRSGGRHYLLRHLDGVRNSESKIAPGIDVRGDGGYIVWWPATGLPVPVRGPLAPWPDSLRPILLPPPAPRPEPVSAAYAAAPDDTAAARIIHRVLYRLETAPAGERHRRLCAAARTIGGLLQSAGISEARAADVLFDAVKRAGGSDVVERNARDTIASGLQFGATAPLTMGGRDAGR